MCGIISSLSESIVENGLDVLRPRGRDNAEIQNEGEYWFGHALHAIVNRVSQPIKHEGMFISNCEIYNWKELRQEYGFDASEVSSDTQLLFKILQIVNLKTIVPKLRGIFAFAFVDKKHGTTSLVRDRFGTKPIYSTYQNSVRYFSSEIG